MRHYTTIDKLIINLDACLAVCKDSAYPATASVDDLSALEKRASARLMRVNHAGEISAQAMYHAQALCAKQPAQRAHMLQAATEEVAHLQWCKRRLDELQGRISFLSPMWYIGAFTIGMVAGLAGDKWSLGFVAETEAQVSRHLAEHLDQLPPADKRSRQIISVMQQEEITHRQQAIDAGGSLLPSGIKNAMQILAKVMTSTAHWL